MFGIARPGIDADTIDDDVEPGDDADLWSFDDECTNGHGAPRGREVSEGRPHTGGRGQLRDDPTELSIYFNLFQYALLRVVQALYARGA